MKIALVTGIAVAGLIGFATLADAKGPPADKGNKNARARSRMVRPADSTDTDLDAKGRIDIAQMKGDRASLRVMGQNLDPGTEVTFRIRGDEEFGAGTVNDEGGVHVFLRTKKGDDLPLDADETTVGDLENDLVEILKGETVLLAGTVPSLVKADLPRRFHGRARLENVDAEAYPEARGRMRLVFRRRDCRSRVVIAVAGLTEGDAVSFRIADADVGAATADAEGNARYVVRTDHGDPLPEGYETSLDLRGLDVAVHVNAGVEPQLTGTLPGTLPDAE